METHENEYDDKARCLEDIQLAKDLRQYAEAAKIAAEILHNRGYDVQVEICFVKGHYKPLIIGIEKMVKL